MSRLRPGVLPAWLPALLVALLLAGCSTVPTSSPTVQLTQAPARAGDVVGIEPLPPEPGATPEEVVRGFIDAAASTVRGHPVARQHLTPQAFGTWSDEDRITIVSPDYAAVTTDPGTVEVTAKLVGTVDPRGVFSVGDQPVYTRSFHLQQVKGQWRIGDPPPGLLILRPDFERLYDRRDAFFVDPTGKRLVPDPRYLITGPAQPTTLVERLLAGPSAALAPGVRNPLAGVQLRRAVTAGPRAVTVDLTGIGSQPAPVLAEISAQLVWTLDQLAVHSVEILVDGAPLEVPGVPSVQTNDDWSSFDPDATPAGSVGHYVDRGALRTVDGRPAPGPAGAGAYSLTTGAIASDERTGNPATLVGMSAGPDSATLLTGPYGGELAPVFRARTLSAPTLAATRAEVWVVADGGSVLRLTPGGQPQPVDAPGLPGLGRVQQLRLSPDGVRAAVVVDGPTGPTLYVGVVVRSPDGAVVLRSLAPVAPSLSRVADVAWRTTGRLLVLAGNAGNDRLVPYRLGVDGFGLEAVPTAGLPSQPTALAAAPGRQPLVSAGGTIWQQVGGTWVTLLRGQEPLPGTAPFYPV